MVFNPVLQEVNNEAVPPGDNRGIFPASFLSYPYCSNIRFMQYNCSGMEIFATSVAVDIRTVFMTTAVNTVLASNTFLLEILRTYK